MPIKVLDRLDRKPRFNGFGFHLGLAAELAGTRHHHRVRLQAAFVIVCTAHATGKFTFAVDADGNAAVVADATQWDRRIGNLGYALILLHPLP